MKRFSLLGITLPSRMVGYEGIPHIWMREPCAELHLQQSGGDTREEVMYFIRCSVPARVEFISIFLCRYANGSRMCVYINAFPLFF